MSDIKLDEIHSMLKEKLTYQQIADHYGVNQGTIYNMIKREKQKRFQLPSRKAKEIIKQFEITDPPVDLKAIAKHEGFKLFFNKLPSNISGIIESNKKEKNIFINSDHAPTRQRFSLGHELGHHFLNHFEDGEHKDTTTIFRKEDEVLEIDREANRFASELLMPAVLVKKQIALAHRELDPELLEQMASTFEVSTIALTYRLQNLGFELL
jgi:Zn-dependent peptidase ImmA (M78 family)